MSKISSAKPIHTRKWATGIGFVALMGLLCFAPLPADAQSAGKRSATSGRRGPSSMRRSTAPMRRSAASFQRSTDSEKKGSLNSQKRGGDSFSESSRDRSAFGRNDDSEDDIDESDSDERNDAAGGDDDEEESSEEGAAQTAPEDFSTRTLGKACMYGVRGEVIFRPAGRRCRGDGSGPSELAPAAKAAGRSKRLKAPNRADKPVRPKTPDARREAQDARRETRAVTLALLGRPLPVLGAIA